jgi:Ca2+-binding EF-hand superfamily protein
MSFSLEQTESLASENLFYCQL